MPKLSLDGQEFSIEDDRSLPKAKAPHGAARNVAFFYKGAAVNVNNPNTNTSDLDMDDDEPTFTDNTNSHKEKDTGKRGRDLGSAGTTSSEDDGDSIVTGASVTEPDESTFHLGSSKKERRDQSFFIDNDPTDEDNFSDNSSDGEEGIPTKAEHERTMHDTAYYKSYGDLSVHQLMLEDGPRMSFYYDTLSDPDIVVPGESVVVDLGCGSGVLSLFACGVSSGPHASASPRGARRVLSIEANTEMSTLAAVIAEENDLRVAHVKPHSANASGSSYYVAVRGGELGATESDSAKFLLVPDNCSTGSAVPQMCVINATGEMIIANGVNAFIETFLLNELYQMKPAFSSDSPGDGAKNNGNTGNRYLYVSHLVSEWMGFYLLHECMLPSVLQLRDFITKVNRRVHELNHFNSHISGAPHLGADEEPTASRPASEAAVNFAPEMIPSEATLFVAPVTLAPYYHYKYLKPWSDIRSHLDGAARGKGWSMVTMAQLQYRALIASTEESRAPLVIGLNDPEELRIRSGTNVTLADAHHRCLLHEPQPFAHLDLRTLPATHEGLGEEELSAVSVVGRAKFRAQQSPLFKARHAAMVGPDAASYYRFSAESKGGPCGVDGFAVWFDVSYTGAARNGSRNSVTQSRHVDPVSGDLNPSPDKHRCYTLSTSPDCPPTHWKQSILLLPAPHRPIETSSLIADDSDMQITISLQRVKGRYYKVTYGLE